MSRTDLISDAFTVIRNAIRVRKDEALLPFSNLIMKICEILKNEGYIENYKDIDLGNFKKIKVYLKYDGKKSAITQIRKVSKPGRRVYLSKGDVFQVLRGYGIGIFSTSLGLLTDTQAREKGVGGEYLGEIW